MAIHEWCCADGTKLIDAYRFPATTATALPDAEVYMVAEATKVNASVTFASAVDKD